MMIDVAIVKTWPAKKAMMPLTAHLRQLVESELGDMDEQARNQLAGIVRCLGASHTWLRLREGWGIDGHESGPLVRWAIETLIEAARGGGLPGAPRIEEELS